MKAVYWKTQIIDEKPVKLYRVVVHAFGINEIDDEPIIHAAQPLYDWEHSEAGQWIIENAVEKPTWHTHFDPASYQTKFAVTAILRERDYVAWTLKFE